MTRLSRENEYARHGNLRISRRQVDEKQARRAAGEKEDLGPVEGVETVMVFGEEARRGTRSRPAGAARPEVRPSRRRFDAEQEGQPCDDTAERRCSPLSVQYEAIRVQYIAGGGPEATSVAVCQLRDRDATLDGGYQASVEAQKTPLRGEVIRRIHGRQRAFEGGRFNWLV